MAGNDNYDPAINELIVKPVSVYISCADLVNTPTTHLDHLIEGHIKATR